MGGLFGGKNSFFNKPLGKNSDASKVVGAALQPINKLASGLDALVKGDSSKATAELGKAWNSSLPGGQLSNMGLRSRLDKWSQSVGDGASDKSNLDQVVGGVKSSAKIAAVVGVAYAGGSAIAGSGSSAPAGTFGSQSSYLGAETSFGATAPATTSGTGYLGASGTFGSTAAPAGSSSLLGVNTTFAEKSASSSFLSTVSKKVSDYGSGYWDRVGEKAVDTAITSTVVGLFTGGAKQQASPDVFSDGSGRVSALPSGPTTPKTVYGLEESGINFQLILIIAGAAGAAFLLFKKIFN